MKYAAGGQEDKIERNRPPHRISILIILLRIIVVVLIILLFAPLFTQHSLQVKNKAAVYNQSTKSYQISFELENTSFGLIFNPEYTITVTKDGGNTIYFQTTEKGALAMFPKQSIKRYYDVPVPSGTPIKYGISTRYIYFTPFGQSNIK
jgi:hypothetical protein